MSRVTIIRNRSLTAEIQKITNDYNLQKSTNVVAFGKCVSRGMSKTKIRICVMRSSWSIIDNVELIIDSVAGYDFISRVQTIFIDIFFNWARS